MSFFKKYAEESTEEEYVGVLGDMKMDPFTHTISVSDGTQWTSINTEPVNPAFAIHEGTVQFGNLKMDVEQFESCLRHLLELTKEANPEDFI